MIQFKIAIVEIDDTQENRYSSKLRYEQTVDTLNIPAVIAVVNQFTIAPTAAEIAAGLKS